MTSVLTRALGDTSPSLSLRLWRRRYVHGGQPGLTLRRVVPLPKQGAKCVPTVSQLRSDARRARGYVRRHRGDPTLRDMQRSRRG